MAASSAASCATAVGLRVWVGVVEVLTGRDAGQHQHAARADRLRCADVGLQPVTDDDGRLDRYAGRIGGGLEERRAGLADDEVRLAAGGRGQRSDDGAGAGLQRVGPG